MKKLMLVIAVGVVGSVMADNINIDTYKEVDNIQSIQLSGKSVDPNGVKSTKEAGIVVTYKGEAKPVTFLWNTKEKVSGTFTVAKGATESIRKDFTLKNPLAAKVEPVEFMAQKAAGNKVGGGFVNGDCIAYGSGSAKSISGNYADNEKGAYGTWKLADDKASLKLVNDKKYTIGQVLAKKKVELIQK